MLSSGSVRRSTVQLSNEIRGAEVNLSPIRHIRMLLGLDAVCLVNQLLGSNSTTLQFRIYFSEFEFP